MAGGGGVKLARDARGGGCVVDVDRAGLQAAERPVRPQRDLAKIVIVADAGEDEIRALRSFLRRGRELAAELRNPGLRLAKRAVIDGDIVPALGADMPGHGIAHDAQPNKRNLAHRDTSWLVRA